MRLFGLLLFLGNAGTVSIGSDCRGKINTFYLLKCAQLCRSAAAARSPLPSPNLAAHDLVLYLVPAGGRRLVLTVTRRRIECFNRSTGRKLKVKVVTACLSAFQATLCCRFHL